MTVVTQNLGPCLNTFKWHTQKVTTRVSRCASGRQPMFTTRCFTALKFWSKAASITGYARQGLGGPARRIVGTGAHHLWPHLSFARNARHSLCFVLENFLKLVTEVLTVHMESLCEQSMIIVLCSSHSTSDVITFSITQHRLHSFVCPPLHHCPQTQNASFVIFSDTD